jgi:hypothetical protein
MIAAQDTFLSWDSQCIWYIHFLRNCQLLVLAASASPYLRFCWETYWGCLIENCGLFWVASGFSRNPSKPILSDENMWETVVVCLWSVVWEGNRNMWETVVVCLWSVVWGGNRNMWETVVVCLWSVVWGGNRNKWETVVVCLWSVVWAGNRNMW